MSMEGVDMDNDDGQKKIDDEDYFKEYRDEIKRLEDKIALLEQIIERYREYIEKEETKTVTEMKRMIDLDNERIKELADNIKREFIDYNPDEHLMAAIDLVMKRIRKIRRVRSPILFWMDIDEILKYDIGDLMDIAVLTCSILRVLGSEDAKVLVLDDGTPFVMFVYSGKHYMMDLENHVVKPLDQNIKKRYAFNDKEFINYQESE